MTKGYRQSAVLLDWKHAVHYSISLVSLVILLLRPAYFYTVYVRIRARA